MQASLNNCFANIALFAVIIHVQLSNLNFSLLIVLCQAMPCRYVFVNVNCSQYTQTLLFINQELVSPNLVNHVLIDEQTNVKVLSIRHLEEGWISDKYQNRKFI